MSFEGKVVLVTGSSSGIGAATAVSFAREGAHVVITGRNEENLKNVEELCEKQGKKPLVLKADVANDADAEYIVKSTIDKFGKLDVLVNNAGIIRYTTIQSPNVLESYQDIFRTNVYSVLNITRLAVPHLIASKGNIVNISSVAASSVTSPMFLVYGASKSALNSMSRCLALELADSGVRVNIVSPGPVRTNILESAGVNRSWDDIGQTTPLKRVGESEEIADLILFLASDKARSITGSEYVSDNGYLLVK